MVSPIGWKNVRVDVLYKSLTWNIDRENDKVVWCQIGIDMNENFERGKRLRRRRINRRLAFMVPASAVAPRAFAAERTLWP